MAFDISILLRLVDRLTGPARTAGASYNALGNQISATSKRITASSSQSVGALNRVNAAANAASASVGRLATNMRNMRTMTSGFAGLGLGGGGGAMVAAFPLIHMLKNAANYEDKLLDIQKVWQGTEADYERMVKRLRRMNTEIPMPRADIATLLEEGVKSGISRDVDELAEFTLAAAKFATAFQLPNVEDAAQKLAKIKGSLGLTMDEFTAMADSMNTVAANFATTEADLLDIIRRVGGLSKAIGGDKGLADLIVIGGAQTAAGVKKEVAATGLRSLLARLSTQPKDTKDGLTELGLNPDEVAKRLPTDMFGTVLDILQRISEAPVEKQAGLLSKIAGMRTFDAFAPLLGNLDLMEKLRKIYDDPFRLTMDDEYERRIKGINSALQITSNVLGELSDSIVMAWKPQIIGTLKWLRELSESMKGSAILQWIAAFFAGLAALSLVALPFGIIGASIFSVVLGLRTLGQVFRFALVAVRPFLGIVTGVASGLIGAVSSFARASVLAYRFAGALGTATVAFRALRRLFGIGLAIEGIILLVQNWEKLKEFSANPLKFDVIFPEAPDWLKWLMKGYGQHATEMEDLARSRREMIGGWLDGIAKWWQQGDASGGALDHWTPTFAGIREVGIPQAVLRKPDNEKKENSIFGPTAQPAVTNNTHTTVTNNVTVHVQTNADPNAIGAATANAVGSKLRGALSDAPHGAP